jgi:hypothetical protein
MKPKTNCRVGDVVNCTVCEWVISAVGGAYKSNRTLYESALKGVEDASVAAAGLAQIRAKISVEGDTKHPSLDKFLNGLVTNEGSVDRTRKIISNDVFWALAQAVNHWPVLFEVRDAVCHEADRAGSDFVCNAMYGSVAGAVRETPSQHSALDKFLKGA